MCAAFVPAHADPAVLRPMPAYSLVDLGTVPMVADDVHASVNSAGQVAMWHQIPGGTLRPIVTTRSSDALLGDAPGYPNAIPSAINGKGTVVGWANTSQNAVDSGSTTRGFIWSARHFETIGTLGGRDSRAFGINDNNQIVGVSTLADGTRHAFLSTGKSLKDLGTLAGGTFSEARAINRAGDIVGTSDIGAGQKHAVLWHKGRIVDLGGLPDGGVSSARAINDQGDIAGYASTPDGYHAFLYTHGAMQDLGTLGADPSEATGINDSGQVVGTSNIDSERRHGFIWQDAKIVDLNTLVSQRLGFNITGADSISNSGAIICTGSRTHDRSHFLLLTPTTLSASH